MDGTPTRNHSDPDDGDVHVMPTYGREHCCAPDCWCEPEHDYTAPNGHKVWVHRDMN